MNLKNYTYGKFKVKPKSIVHYFCTLEPTYRSTRQIENEKNLKDNQATTISRKAAANIRTKIEYLVSQATWKTIYLRKEDRTIRFKINFITLTLSAKQVHDDRKIKAVVLNNFLNEVRRKYSVKNYIWRAEKQKNGNIHFHVTTDKYIHHQEIRKIWNNSQNLLGYIDEFEKKNGHRNPNSTDVHAVKNIKNLAAYLTKYLTKKDTNPEAQQIQGRQWFISQSLSKIKDIVLEQDEVEYDEIKQALINGACHKKIESDFATIYLHDWDKVIKNSQGSAIYDRYINLLKGLNST